MTHENPYRSLPDFHFWRKSVAASAPGDLDPVVSTSFTINSKDKVASAGSCFAQHIARQIRSKGFNFFDAEPAHPIVPAELHDQYSYGIFSARYGNIYTARQLMQLFRRAYDQRDDGEAVWKIETDKFFDPFRPNIQPGGFSSLGDLLGDRRHHLARVRYLFENLDCFVFTLGLTESWEGSEDGIAYPVCPALFDPDFSMEKYRFVNYSVENVRTDLQAFIAALRSINPRASLLLTVSPVPLVATFEPRNVLCSTTYSKSVLRVAAEEVARMHDRVDYFPAYEIITGNYNRGHYFAEDLRSVTQAGVAHVMRIFFKHYAGDTSGLADPMSYQPTTVDTRAQEFSNLSMKVNQALCDEELLDR